MIYEQRQILNHSLYLFAVSKCNDMIFIVFCKRKTFNGYYFNKSRTGNYRL